MGTWDFKWPEDAEIRVAFQKPSGVDNADFEAAKTRVMDLARRWHDKQAKLAFVPLDADFGAPVETAKGRHPQRRSDAKGEVWRVYDVLVSLEPLNGLTRRDTLGGKEELIFLPQSELGTYARRIDFGTPTMFLGPMPSYQGTLAGYYENPMAQMMVVHEFGHALGLAHEHQNPLARKALGLALDKYDLDKALRILVNKFGVPAEVLPAGAEETRDFLEAHLGTEWPGNPRFSDWREYGPNAKLDSIMSVAYHDCSLKNPDHSCGAEDCPSMRILTRPTDTDFAAVNAMYD
jgi:hypothetical protein